MPIRQRSTRPGGRRLIVVEPFLEWHEQAACCDEPAELFYGPEGESQHERLARESRAVAICNRCPVRTPCQKHALKRPEPYGVWGGTTESSRSATRRSNGEAPSRRRLAAVEQSS
jgi:WhiB family redox-sensing transcriptional regulator